MDPITHAMFGGLAAKTTKVPKRRFWIMVLLGLLLDIDVLGNWAGNWSPIIGHHGITHSILGAAVITGLITVLLSRLDPGPFWSRYALYSLPIGLHLLGDLATCYPIPLFAPFSWQGYSLDLVGSVNLIPSFIMGGFLVWMVMRDKNGFRSTAPVWGIWLVYFVFAATIRTYAGNLVTDANRLEPVPSVVNPLAWRAIDTRADRYRQYSISVWDQESTLEAVIERPADEFPIQASKKSEAVQRFLASDRWPVVQTEIRDDGWLVEWGTIVFSVRGLVRSKVRLIIDAEGNILNEDHVFHFWDPPQLT